jgi:hypothetical protein
MLHEINKAAAIILKERELEITTMEKSLIDRFIREYDKLTEVSLKEGSSYANQYEIQYRKLIEEFIKNLEIEMAKHLDYLQQEIETDRQSIFIGVNTNIDRITKQADKARSDFHRILQIYVATRRQAIMQIIDHMSQDKTNQPIGYEQLRKLEVDIYSTVGVKSEENCCIQIQDRKKFHKDIEEAKQMKRTVYLSTSSTTQQTTYRTNQ